jgi:hypothetical protein
MLESCLCHMDTVHCGPLYVGQACIEKRVTRWHLLEIIQFSKASTVRCGARAIYRAKPGRL